jgi:hypothetical protein
MVHLLPVRGGVDDGEEDHFPFSILYYFTDSLGLGFGDLSEMDSVLFFAFPY